MSNDELYKMIKKLNDKEIKLVQQYIKQITDDASFEEALNYTIEKYDKSFEGFKTDEYKSTAKIHPFKQQVLYDFMLNRIFEDLETLTRQCCNLKVVVKTVPLCRKTMCTECHQADTSFHVLVQSTVIKHN